MLSITRSKNKFDLIIIYFFHLIIILFYFVTNFVFKFFLEWVVDFSRKRRIFRIYLAFKFNALTKLLQLLHRANFVNSLNIGNNFFSDDCLHFNLFYFGQVILHLMIRSGVNLFFLALNKHLSVLSRITSCPRDKPIFGISISLVFNDLVNYLNRSSRLVSVQTFNLVRIKKCAWLKRRVSLFCLVSQLSFEIISIFCMVDTS